MNYLGLEIRQPVGVSHAAVQQCCGALQVAVAPAAANLAVTAAGTLNAFNCVSQVKQHDLLCSGALPC